jgi:hypothetical protein
LTLTIGAALLLASAVRTSAGDPQFDIEGTGYAGTSTGGWTCGPTASARYAGGAAHVMISQRPRHDPDGAGLMAVAGGSLEGESVRLESGATEGGTFEPDGTPARAMGALHARLGDEDRWFGFQLGAIGFQGWSSPDIRTRKWAVWPELRFRVGPPAIMYGVLGFGSDTPSTVRRPATIYTGVGGAYDWGGFDARIGLNRAGPSLGDDFSLRTEGVVRVRVLDGFFVSPGLAVQFPNQNEGSPGWEGSVGFELGLGASSHRNDTP